MTLPLNEAAVALVLVFCRVGGCFLVIPGLSSARVPVQARILLAAALAVAMAPVVWPYASARVRPDAAQLTHDIFQETFTGFAIGLTTRLLMLALSFGASAAAMSIGLGGLQGSGIEETEPQASMVSFITMSALTLLFIMDFHHDVIRALISSYALLPVGQALGVERMLANLLDTLTDSFLIVLRLASPFLVYSLVANLAIGLLNKLTPQLPIYFISLPFVLAGGLLLSYFAMPNMLSLFAQGFLELNLTARP